MTEYERTLAIDAPADAVFQYVSDASNVPKFLPLAEGAEFEVSAENRTVSWTKEEMSGSIEVDGGDITPELSEIVLRLEYADREPSDPPTAEDEETLDEIDRALRQIHDHVKHAHTKKANFL